MASCNEDLQRANKPYPRTCAICGIGKCQRQDRHENAALKQVAGLIGKLSYRDMQTLATTLRDKMNIKDEPFSSDVAVCLLDAADEILGANKEPPKMPLPEPGDYRR